MEVDVTSVILSILGSLLAVGLFLVPVFFKILSEIKSIKSKLDEGFRQSDYKVDRLLGQIDDLEKHVQRRNLEDYTRTVLDTVLEKNGRYGGLAGRERYDSEKYGRYGDLEEHNHRAIVEDVVSEIEERRRNKNE